MALAFEYNLNTEYSFKTSFQEQMAEYLSESYMEYINEQNLSVLESAVGFDLNDDGDMDDTIVLTIEYDLKAHEDTNGYYGTYLDLYMAEFIQNLQWYLDNLDYAEGWTWFDEEGNALRNKDVASMTSEDKAQAFIEGRYTKSLNGNMIGHDMPGENIPNGEKPDGNMPSGETPNNNIQKGEKSDKKNSNEMIVGTPDRGTTQSATGSGDSTNYKTYEEIHLILIKCMGSMLIMLFLNKSQQNRQRTEYQKKQQVQT